MRDKMPSIAALIDVLRDQFGREEIDAEIRAGIKGEPGRFHAREGGHEIGTTFPVEQGVSLRDMVWRKVKGEA